MRAAHTPHGVSQLPVVADGRLEHVRDIVGSVQEKTMRDLEFIAHQRRRDRV